jgi:hypothetical protein
MNTISPFYKPTVPTSGFEMLKWAFFEPVLLDRFSKTLDREGISKWLLKTYPWVILVTSFTYLALMAAIIILDIPSHYAPLFKSEFLVSWKLSNNNLYKIFLENYLIALAFGLSFVLLGGVSDDFAKGLVSGIAFTLIVGLAVTLNEMLSNGIDGTILFSVLFSFIAGFGLGLIGTSVYGFVRGLWLGLITGILFSMLFGFAGILSGGLANGFVYGAVIGLTVWFIFILTFYFTYFRIYAHLLHIILLLFSKTTFTSNPYISDGVVWFSLPLIQDRLTKLTREYPLITLEFVNFLLEYRPRQRPLAMEILHFATAERWHNNILNADILAMPIISTDIKGYMPSEKWTEKLSNMKEQLIAYEKESNIERRKDFFESFVLKLNIVLEQTLMESRLWNHFYIGALHKWLNIAKRRLDSLREQAKTAQPITANIYRPGISLDPLSGAEVFVGRDDVKADFKNRVLTSPSMPMFLIQGQRRVGKTSLIKFLPEYLGPRFKIIFKDMQDGTVLHIPAWFSDIRDRVNKKLSLSSDNWKAPTDWLNGWNELRSYLETVTAQKDFKLVLAFDEYEIIHELLEKDPDNAKRLLGALRSFSQHQNNVVFLFAGAQFFTELRNPNWGEFFVQSIVLHVDYLKKEDTLKLITKPVPDFNLVYPPEVALRIYDLTQGHPALVQLICSEMVDIANRDGKRDMTFSDLQETLKKTITRQTLAINIFWSQFCNEADKTTVREILDGKKPSDKSSIARLFEHGFIVKDNGGSPDGSYIGNPGESVGKGNIRMRVPLFEQWLRQYSDTSY